MQINTHIKFLYFWSWWWRYAVNYFWEQTWIRSVSTVTRRGWTIRVWFPVGSVKGIFSLHHHNQISSGAHLVSYPVGTIVLTTWVNWLGHEADHSPPCSAEVKAAWHDTSTLPYTFVLW